MLEERLRAYTSEVVVQEFPVRFRGELLRCANVVGVFRAHGAQRAEGAGPAGDAERAGRTGRANAPVLLGTHYDTRFRADRDADPAQREKPIPGANDGGSGTAVLLHLLPWLARSALERDVAVAFFDAEDLGNIDGKEFSIGAAWCADHPVSGFVPSEVVVLDMVGGRDMVLDIDAHILDHPGTRRLTTEIFRIGFDEEWEPFCRDKPQRVKYIISDHYPFLCRGIDSCILIDIDYPQWHTQQDVPSALGERSLGVIEAALSLFLSPRKGRAHHGSAGSAGP
jgi:glutaminyl-peptide cyclotransferase